VTSTFKVTVPVDYWCNELQDITDEFIMFKVNSDTVTMYCIDMPDELIQGMSTNDLVEFVGVDSDYVLSTNHEDLM